MCICVCKKQLLYYLSSIRFHHHLSLSVVSFVFILFWQCNSIYNVRVIIGGVGGIDNITRSNIITSNTWSWSWSRWWYDTITGSNFNGGEYTINGRNDDCNGGGGCGRGVLNLLLLFLLQHFLNNIIHSSSDTTKRVCENSWQQNDDIM